jgi:hypothetical protein
MSNNFKKGLLLGFIVCILYYSIAIIVLSTMEHSNKQKIDYQLEIVDENHIRLMDENGKSLYITTFDSIGYYIEQDNL